MNLLPAALVMLLAVPAFAAVEFDGIVDASEILSDARAQVSSGWRLDLSTTNGVVEALFLNERGVAQTGLVVTSLAVRPSSASQDRVLSWRETGESYRADAGLAPGQWALDVAARRNGEIVFRELRRVLVPVAGTL